MLSRVANSIYWMARYIERAENVARFLDVNYNLMLDTVGPEKEQWQPLVMTTGDQALYAKHYGRFSQDNVVRFLAIDDDNPNSILACVNAARENARTVREIISSEMWEQVNKFYHMVQAAARSAAADALAYDFYTEVKLASQLFAGISDATMSHNEAWHFLSLGRAIERADKTSRILDVKYFVLLPHVSDVGSTIDANQWAALLRSASAEEMYRKRHGQILPEKIAEFLILDAQFPRAIAFCVNSAQESIRAVTGSPRGTFSNPAEQALGRLRAELNYATIDEIISGGLHEYLDALQLKLNRFDDAIYATFFAIRPVDAAHTQAQHQNAA